MMFPCMRPCESTILDATRSAGLDGNSSHKAAVCCFVSDLVTAVHDSPVVYGVRVSIG